MSAMSRFWCWPTEWIMGWFNSFQMERAIKKTVSFTRTCRVWKCDINGITSLLPSFLSPSFLFSFFPSASLLCLFLAAITSCRLHLTSFAVSSRFRLERSSVWISRSRWRHSDLWRQHHALWRRPRIWQLRHERKHANRWFMHSRKQSSVLWYILSILCFGSLCPLWKIGVTLANATYENKDQSSFYIVINA